MKNWQFASIMFSIPVFSYKPDVLNLIIGIFWFVMFLYFLKKGD